MQEKLKFVNSHYSSISLLVTYLEEVLVPRNWLLFSLQALPQVLTLQLPAIVLVPPQGNILIQQQTTLTSKLLQELVY